MATQIDHWPGATSGWSKYPWDEWLNGSIWRLTPGKDFPGTPDSFRSLAHGAALKRHGTLRTSIKNGSFFLQFTPDGQS